LAIHLDNRAGSRGIPRFAGESAAAHSGTQAGTSDK
jgi:hypothetical protein